MVNHLGYTGRTCPGCKTTYYVLAKDLFADEDPSTECSVCIKKRESKQLVKEINAALKGGKLLSAWRRYPVRPAERHFIEKARTTTYGHTEIRWRNSHVWQSIKRDEIKGLEPAAVPERHSPLNDHAYCPNCGSVQPIALWGSLMGQGGERRCTTCLTNVDVP